MFTIVSTIYVHRYVQIAEELQLVKLEGEDNDDPKFTDWSRQDEDDWSKFRLLWVYNFY